MPARELGSWRSIACTPAPSAGLSHPSGCVENTTGHLMCGPFTGAICRGRIIWIVVLSPRLHSSCGVKGARLSCVRSWRSNILRRPPPSGEIHGMRLSGTQVGFPMTSVITRFAQFWTARVCSFGIRLKGIGWSRNRVAVRFMGVCSPCVFFPTIQFHIQHSWAVESVSASGYFSIAKMLCS